MTRDLTEDVSDHYDGKNYVIAAACVFSVMLLFILIVIFFCENRGGEIVDDAVIEEEKKKSKLYEIVYKITAIDDDCAKRSWAAWQLIVSAAFLVLLSITFVNFYKDDDNVPEKAEDMRSLSKFFVSVQFLLMVKAIDRTVDTGAKLYLTRGIYDHREWKIYSIFFTVVQISQLLVFSFFVMVAVHRTETVYDMIVSIGAIHALQDVDLLLIEGFETIIGLILCATEKLRNVVAGLPPDGMAL